MIKPIAIHLPECFNEEKDVAFPLCIGKNEKECYDCALFTDFGKSDCEGE